MSKLFPRIGAVTFANSAGISLEKKNKDTKSAPY